MNNINKLCLACSLMLCCLFSETRIGYIDSQIILTQFEDVRQVQVELEKEQKKLQTIYEKKIISLDSLKNSYETGSIILSDNKKQEMLIQIEQKEKEIQQWQLQYVGPEGELYRLQNELMNPILKVIDQAISTVGKEKEYDYIFDAAAGGIVYALDANNLTQDVLNELQKINTTPDSDNE